MPRKKRWMSHPIQTKYLATVVFAMLAPTLVTAVCLYQLIFTMLAQQIAFPEAINANLKPVVERVNVFLFVTLPVLGFGVVWWAISISHRFAGPLARLESELDRILAGDHSKKIQVRENDDLKPIADKINLLLEKLPR